VIARTICHYLYAAGVGAADVRCHDIDEPSARALATCLSERHDARAVTATAAQALDCDLVVLATTALRPHIAADHTFRPGQLVLNVSLRDLAPETLLRAGNVLDDVDHCLTADTSPHLAERLSGGRNFITGTLAQVMRGVRRPDPATATIFSPFGLGVLDLAVGHYLYGLAESHGNLLAVPGFFGDFHRW
jgi:ornithine cyclodeaminase